MYLGTAGIRVNGYIVSARALYPRLIYKLQYNTRNTKESNEVIASLGSVVFGIKRPFQAYTTRARTRVCVPSAKRKFNNPSAIVPPLVRYITRTRRTRVQPAHHNRISSSDVVGVWVISFSIRLI